MGASSTRSSRTRIAEADEFYATVTPADLSPDATQCDAAGLRRTAVVEAVLPLRGARLAERRSRAPAAAASAQERPQSRVDAPLQRRRDLHAGQVGVSVVRRVGPGIPLRAARAGRFGVRQGATHADAARMVHASERAAAGLRVGVRRRQSAGACVGGVARLQDREEAPRRGRPRLSWSASSTSCCSISPGG